MRTLLTTFILLSFSFFAGCSGGNKAVDGKRDAYPEGPYSVKEKGVIKSEVFKNPDGSSLSFEDLFLNADNKLLLLSTAAGWCSACREEQSTLEAIYQEYKDKGLVIMVTLFEDDNSQVADLAFVKAWKKQYELTYHVVLDKDFVMQEYYDRKVTPMNLLVDLNDMKILRINTGWDESATRAILTAKL